MSDTNFEYLDRLQEERNRAWNRAQELMNRADAEKRSLSPEDRVELDRLEKVISENKDEAARVHRMAEAVRTADSFRMEMAPRVEAARDQRREASDAEMLAAMIRGERRDGFESRPSAAFESRALQSAGGSAIPTTFSDILTVYERSMVPVLQVATVINTPTGNPIVFPRLTADPAYGGTVVAEAAGITELDPTLSTVQLDSYKYAIVTLWSAELGTDNVIGLEDLVARASARELSIDIGAHFTTGDGSGKPNGIINAAANGGTALGTASGSATDTFFSATDLVNLYYSLAIPYRDPAAWMVSTTAAAKMRSFRDSNKNFLWEPGALRAMDGLDRFLGKPVYENPAMAAVASATKSVVFGDFSRYFIRRLPTRIETSSDYKFSTDQVAIKVVERMDGDLIDTSGIAYLVSANT